MTLSSQILVDSLEQALEGKLEMIRKVFNIEEMKHIVMDGRYILEYYRLNQIPYTIFQFHTDLIHVGISRDGVFKKEDLLEGARMVERYTRSAGAQRVLELAAGRGANSYYLARVFPLVRFDGIDFSEIQLAYARKKAKTLGNFSPTEGDYHDLSRYGPESFDIVFIIESLCYSVNKGQVFAEVFRVLKPGGIFLIIDGYLRKDLNAESLCRKEAFRLMEMGVAVEKFELYEYVRDKACAVGFTIGNEEDVTEYVLPFMLRYEKLARRFFNHPFLARLGTKLLSREFSYNAISGFLFPEMMRARLFVYMITVLKKP